MRWILACETQRSRVRLDMYPAWFDSGNVILLAEP
jgi:hypothetical protein